MTTIYLGQEYDGFSIVVTSESGDEKRFYFNQEDTVEGMVELFEHLGFEDVEYEEVC